MPTHIFIQHGMWQQVSDSNQSAYEAAVALWEPGDRAGDMTHSLDWGQYVDLQLGDYERAQLWIDRMQGVAERNRGQARVAGALPRVKARFILETRQWAIQPIREDSTAVELLATGFSAVHLGDLEAAQEVAARLAEMVAADSGDKDSSYYSRTTQPLRIMHKEVAGLLAIATGDTEDGLALLKEAVAIAETMRPPNGAPNPIKPPHELYGEELLKAAQPGAASSLFAASLLRTPNRPLSLLGLARAYVALGDSVGAAEQYQKLAEVWKGRGFPLLEEASRHLAAAAD